MPRPLLQLRNAERFSEDASESLLLVQIHVIHVHLSGAGHAHLRNWDFTRVAEKVALPARRNVLLGHFGGTSPLFARFQLQRKTLNSSRISLAASLLLVSSAGGAARPASAGGPPARGRSGEPSLVRPNRQPGDAEPFLGAGGGGSGVASPAERHQPQTVHKYPGAHSLCVRSHVFIHAITHCFPFFYLAPVAAGSAEKTDPACPSLP